MSRILIGWELGLNLGHLARLRPIAQALKARGHSVLCAVRDMQAAAALLGPAQISFVPAPHLPRGLSLPHRATGYADILLSQGWGDPSALWGLTQGWINLYRLFRPDVLALDYAPTACLASRIAHIPTVLIGNGFELPPPTNPLPPFPGFSWAMSEKAQASETLAVRNANAVARAYKGRTLASLRALFDAQACLLATFPELDHYGPRPSAEYIGPLLGEISTVAVQWPEGTGPKIFASLRPDTQNVQAILTALSQSDARIVCVSVGFTAQQLEPYRREGTVFSNRPVDLAPLLDADLCISYGAEGTMIRFLLAGVPQLIAPHHVETYMAVRRIESLGTGTALKGPVDVEAVLKKITDITQQAVFKEAALQFEMAHRQFRGHHAVDQSIAVIEGLASGASVARIPAAEGDGRANQKSAETA